MSKRNALQVLVVPALVAVASLASVPARAADTPAPKPALLVPKAAAASAPASRATAPAKPRKATRALGGDDDLKDLEVERVRGKNR